MRLEIAGHEAGDQRETAGDQAGDGSRSGGRLLEIRREGPGVQPESMGSVGELESSSDRDRAQVRVRVRARANPDPNQA